MVEVKLKVVHISTNSNGGAGRSAYRIHEALMKSGVHSSFLCLDAETNQNLKSAFTLRASKPPIFLRLIRKIKNIVYKHFGVNLFNQGESWTKKLEEIYPFLDCESANLPFSEYNVLNNAVVKNADIIHLHWVARTLDYTSFFEKNEKPVVWTLHDMNAFQGLFHYKEDEIRNKRIAGKLDNSIRDLKQKVIKNRRCKLAVITPSDWLLTEALHSECFKNVPGHCIAYPLDTALFSPQQNKDFRQQYNIPIGNIVFLFAAQAVNHYRKGFDLLVEALNNLKHLSITLLVLGHSKDVVIEGLDIRKLGSINDDRQLRDMYSIADAFIIPSREDNLPNVMLEALACGTPVIGFTVGGIKEHIQENINGLLANEVNSTSLSLVLERFCLQKELLNAEKISAYANEHFNEKLVAQKYIEVYKRILT